MAGYFETILFHFIPPSEPGSKHDAGSVSNIDQLSDWPPRPNTESLEEGKKEILCHHISGSTEYFLNWALWSSGNTGNLSFCPQQVKCQGVVLGQHRHQTSHKQYTNQAWLISHYLEHNTANLFYSGALKIWRLTMPKRLLYRDAHWPCIYPDRRHNKSITTKPGIHTPPG